jgi:hypothetical protein
LYRQDEAPIPTFRRTGKLERGLPSHGGAVGVARSLGERESWPITLWCDWLRLGERLIPPYKITITFLNSLSFVEAVNKNSPLGLMERWKNQAGVGEIRDFRMRGSETSHARKRRRLSWVWRWLENNPKRFFMRWGVCFQIIGAFRAPHNAWLESSFLTDGWHFI